jgi:predicted DNA-binding transcriptional regulator AlpA
MTTDQKKLDAKIAGARASRKRIPLGAEVMRARETLKPGAFQLLTRAEVVARCKVSYQSLWSAMRRNEFPRGRRFLGTTRWLSSEVDEFLQNLPLQQIKDAPVEDVNIGAAEKDSA